MKRRYKFEWVNGKTIYPRPLHSQELMERSGAFSESVTPIGDLRKKESLEVASRIL